MRDTKIEWAHHTFNPWLGCTKVSPGCANCYAEHLVSHRFKRAEWGPGKQRVRTSAAYWRQPLHWNAVAAKHRVELRVFAASLADIGDRSVPLEWLNDLMLLIEKTPHLTWLLLTKRPQDLFRRLIVIARHWGAPAPIKYKELPGFRRGNVMFGVSAEDQERWDERIWVTCLGVRTFVSAEPLLGPIRIDPRECDLPDWIIVGGESGPKARPMDPEWVRSLRDRCVDLDIPFLFKQWGGRNKAAAGRELDGRTWDEVPHQRETPIFP